jgi:ribonuclease D
MKLMTDLPAPVWVARRAALTDLVTELKRYPRVSVDTEANSLHAYRDRVCLIQFSTPKADYLVDPIELVDLTPLAEIFADPRIEKIFHAVEYDLIGLQRDYDFTICNIFDTMIAARILGYKQVGLGALMKIKFDVTLNKKYQRANWGERPLSPEMIDYARHDTHYLIALRELLADELIATERFDLAQEEFARLCHVNGNNHDARQPWERITGHQNLSPRQKTVLNEICHKRERIAERLDRPLFKVLGDKMLLDMATTQPNTIDELKKLNWTDRQIQRFGHEMIDAVRRGQHAPLVNHTGVEKLPDPVHNRLTKLKEWRKRTADKMGVESDIVLPRAYLTPIAEKNPATLAELEGIMIASPWRLNQYGAEILNVITKKK